MNTILLPTMHKMRVKAKMEARDKDMKKRTKELEIAKGGIYAMPFYRRYMPLAELRESSWCESMEGLQSAEMRGAMT